MRSQQHAWQPIHLLRISQRSLLRACGHGSIGAAGLGLSDRGRDDDMNAATIPQQPRRRADDTTQFAHAPERPDDTRIAVPHPDYPA